jgi:integrase
MSITAPSLGSLPPGKFQTIAKVKPVGSLQARRLTSDAVTFYWRYSQGKFSERVHIGLYDSSSPTKKLEPTPKGYSLAAAIRAAEVLATEHYNAREEGGRPALLEAQLAEAAVRAAEEARAATATVQHLLLAYCDFLQAQGRQCHRNVRSIFQLHVIEAFPDIATKPADRLTTVEFTTIMRKLNDAGKGRTSNKLRSFARAAYEAAIASQSKSSVPERFKEFGIQLNPIAATRPDETANRADKNPISLSELRKYWRLLEDEPGFKGALLRLHLLSGGQRIEQLVRLKTADIKTEEGYFILYDGKGRPGAPARQHWIPLTAPVAKALRECKPKGTYALSTDGGKTPVAGTTLSGWAAEVASPKIAEFTAKRIRSGVETALASVRVPSADRGHLQSHGISGVQRRHYDGHDYLDAKRDALERLHELLFASAASSGTRRSAKGRGTGTRRSAHTAV